MAEQPVPEEAVCKECDGTQEEHRWYRFHDPEAIAESPTGDSK